MTNAPTVQKQHSSVAAELDRRESELTSLQMRHEALVKEQGQQSNQVNQRSALQGNTPFLMVDRNPLAFIQTAAAYGFSMSFGNLLKIKYRIQNLEFKNWGPRWHGFANFHIHWKDAEECMC